MNPRQPRIRSPLGIGGNFGNPPPIDLMVILITLFVTFSMRYFDGAASLPRLLELTSYVWERGLVWQIVTFPFIGWIRGGSPIWFLLELLILFWFGRDVYRYLGPKAFRRLLGWSLITAGVVAVVIDISSAAVGIASPYAFDLMQGQRILLAVMIAAFACAYRNATIMLFFVLPIQARWFIAIEILFAFMGFLTTKDFAGFAGICVAVGMTWAMMSGGLLNNLRRIKLQLSQLWYRARLRSARRKRGLRVVDGGKRGSGPGGSGTGGSGTGGSGKTTPRDPWVH